MPKTKQVTEEARKRVIKYEPFKRMIMPLLILKLQPKEDDPLDFISSISSKAVESLREATELYIKDIFEDSFKCMAHAGRSTLYVDDITLAQRLRKRYTEKTENRKLTPEQERKWGKVSYNELTAQQKLEWKMEDEAARAKRLEERRRRRDD